MDTAQHLWHRRGGIAAGVVLVGCIVLLQWHSVQFWMAQVGTTGIGFSLLLDLLGLWLWYRRTFVTRTLGVLASLLVLAGPIYWVATPIIDQSARASHGDSAREKNIASLESEINERQVMLANLTSRSNDGQWAAVIAQTQADLSRVNADIAVYLNRSEPVPPALQRNANRLREDLRQYQRAVAQRSSAATSADRLQTELTERRVKLATLREVAPTVGVEWRAQVVVLMEIFALVLFQLGAVLAINRISELTHARVAAGAPSAAPPPRRRPGVESAPVSEVNPVSDTPLTTSVSPANQLSNHVLPSINQQDTVTPPITVSALPEPLTTPVSTVNASRLAPVKPPAFLPVPPTALAHPQFRARRILRAQSAFLAALERGETKSSLAAQLQVRPSDVSMFLQHEDLLAKGARVVSEAVMEKFLSRFAPLAADFAETVES